MKFDDVTIYPVLVVARTVRGFDSHRGQKIFSLPRVVPCFPLLGLTLSGLFMGLSSTLIYKSRRLLATVLCRLKTFSLDILASMFDIDCCCFVESEL